MDSLRRVLFRALPLCLLALSCNNSGEGGPEGAMVHTSLSASITGSRISISESGSISWKDDDKICIFTDTDTGDGNTAYPFYITEIKGGKSAKFAGSVVANPSRRHIYALYPFDEDHTTVASLLRAGGFTAANFGRLQGPGSFLVRIPETQEAGLSARYAMMYGAAPVNGSDFSNVKLAFRHLSCLWDIIFSNPERKSVSAVSMKASDTVFPTQCTLDLDVEDALPVNVAWTDSLCFRFSSPQSDSKILARFVLLPMPACPSESIDVKVHYDDGSSEIFKLSGSNSPAEAGARYFKELTLGSGQVSDIEAENYFYASPFEGVPQVSGMKMYEASPRSFAASGSLQAIRSRLDKIAALNVNVLWIMPIFEASAVRVPAGSPYSCRNFEKIDPEYGSLDDLRALVEDAHKLGIAVILDFVTNHSGADCSWVVSHPSWYMDSYDPASGDAALFDWTNEELQNEMLRIMKYWIRMTNIDGYRCDTAMPTRSNGVSLEFWKKASKELKAMQPGRSVIMLAEAANSVTLDNGFDLCYGWHFCDALTGAFDGTMTIDNLFATSAGEWTSPATNEGKSRIRFSTNHDRNSKASLSEIYGSQEAADAAFVIAATMGGVPLLYASQETGYSQRVSFFKSSAKVIDWESNPAIFDRYCTFMTLPDHPALRKGSISRITNEGIVSFIRRYDSREVLVIVNVTDIARAYTLPSLYAGASYTDLLSGESRTLEDKVIPAYGYLILEKK